MQLAVQTQPDVYVLVVACCSCAARIFSWTVEVNAMLQSGPEYMRKCYLECLKAGSCWCEMVRVLAVELMLMLFIVVAVVMMLVSRTSPRIDTRPQCTAPADCSR